VVKFVDKKYGLDQVAGKIRLAGRTLSAGRITIDTIVDFDPEDFNGDLIDSEGNFYFSVPEKNAIIKWVTILSEGNLDPLKLIQFELASSLPDSENRYYFDSHNSGSSEKNLAIAYNRNLIEREISSLQKIVPKPSGFRLRSLAMASAYTNYCHHDGGKLVCLVDISDKNGSYCFLGNKRPLMIGGLENSIDIENKNNDTPDRFIIDLTATLQYALSEISGAGYSIPLSAIIITGPLAGSEMISKIEKSMNVKTGLPHLKKELFAPEIFTAAGNYLVSLGLTVDF
jgi:hypothetical protein